MEEREGEKRRKEDQLIISHMVVVGGGVKEEVVWDYGTRTRMKKRARVSGSGP